MSDGEALHIVLTVMDRATSTVTIVRSDKKEAVFPLESPPFHPDSRITRLSHAPMEHLLLLETVNREDIFAELPRLDDFAPRNGRPVIYLDQKDWSTVANSIYSPDKVPQAERLAAEKLIGWARQRQIILPMSAGHMSETCKWTIDSARYCLALTILQLSFGWQMRDALDVRRHELRRSLLAKLRGQLLAPIEVFTLEPYAIHGATRGTKRPAVPSEFPADLALATRALTSISGNFDTMLDDKPVAMTPTPGWVAKQQVFTDWLATETKRTSSAKRQSIELAFLVDTSKEIAEEAARAGLTPEQMSEWVHQHRETEMALMPSLGLFGESLLGLHLNQTHWEDNHLTDLMYLTCAAGYADFVVAERSLVSQMGQAQKRMGRPLNVYPRIQDVVPEVERRLAQVESAGAVA